MAVNHLVPGSSPGRGAISKVNLPRSHFEKHVTGLVADLLLMTDGKSPHTTPIYGDFVLHLCRSGAGLASPVVRDHQVSPKHGPSGRVD